MTEQTDQSGYNPIITDNPVRKQMEDKFNRYPFAQRIAKTIASLTDPSSLVIAIYGAWGEGKTSILNFMADELKDNHRDD